MPTPAEIPSELLREVCRSHDIPAGDEFLVLARIVKGGAPAACCGSDCRPCVLDIEAAEQELRERLGLTQAP